MKRLILALCLFNTSVMASEDFSCQKNLKKAFVVTCESKKEADVTLVAINGGECNAPAFHKHLTGKFDLPGTKECFYVRSVTLSIDGHNKTFAPL